MRQSRLATRFVETIPETIDEGVLYVSMEYALTMHLCACGCKEEVVTPLSPTDWQLFFDGEAVTLKPSIGNWSFPCRSHYFIRGNRIKWSVSMSDSEIDEGRSNDRKAKETYYGDGEVHSLHGEASNKVEQLDKGPTGLWAKIQDWLNL